MEVVYRGTLISSRDSDQFCDTKHTESRDGSDDGNDPYPHPPTLKPVEIPSMMLHHSENPEPQAH